MLDGDSGGSVVGGDASASPETTGASGSDVLASGGSGSLASGDGGSAPAAAGDAVGGETGPAEAAPPAPPSKFLFAGREWQSQKAAEDAYRASFGRNWEGKLKAAQQEIEQRDAELQALRRALSTGGMQGQGAAPGVPGQAPAAADQGFAAKLVKSGDLEFITGLLNDPDPNQGIAKFTVALADRIDREVNERMERFAAENVQPIVRQAAFEKHMGSAMSVAKQLPAMGFPELDENNQSPEAVEHQQAFVENLKQLPPDFVRDNPQMAFLMTALVTRHQYGIPMVATAPGTSGSPSARAALASEQALQAGAGVPVDGTGTPRPKPNGAGETPLDRIRRENAAAPGNFRSPSGRDLGFGPAV